MANLSFRPWFKIHQNRVKAKTSSLLMSRDWERRHTPCCWCCAPASASKESDLLYRYTREAGAQRGPSIQRLSRNGMWQLQQLPKGSLQQSHKNRCSCQWPIFRKWCLVFSLKLLCLLCSILPVLPSGKKAGRRVLPKHLFAERMYVWQFCAKKRQMQQNWHSP